MRLWSFDAETFKTRQGDQFPRIVCLSYCEIVQSSATPSGWARTPATVLAGYDGVQWVEDRLRDGDAFVGANTAFDVWCVTFSHENPEAMAHLWFQAYEENRVTDVLLRQRLIQLATDTVSHKLNLASVSLELEIPTVLSKGDVEGSPGWWRLRYSLLEGVAIADYPALALQYSREDSEATAECWIVQWEIQRHGSCFFPGRDILADEFRQAYAALALSDISGCGIRTDPKDVGRFRRWAEARKLHLRGHLVKAGLIRAEYQRDLEAIGRLPLPRTPSGGPQMTVKSLAALETTHPLEAALLRDWKTRLPDLWRAGYATRKFIACDDVAKRVITAAFKCLNLPPLSKWSFHKAKIDEETGKKGKWVEVLRVDNDACTQSQSRVMKAWAEYNALDKLLSTDFKMLTTGATGPFHVNFRPLQSTGRTSSGADDDGENDGNGQNAPRKPGVRECYTPREGNVFFDADYSAMELWKFSQICYWLLGYSRLGDDLNAGIDPHLRTGADWLTITEGRTVTYEEAQKRKKEPIVKKHRTGAKGVGFGRKGGMGAKRLVEYCWNNYRLKLTQDEAQTLIDIHDANTPEFADYSELLTTTCLRSDDLPKPRFKMKPPKPGERRKKEQWFDFVHPYSGRCRAGLGYSDLHNYPFQGLASDVAKRALVLVMQARWGWFGRDDALYQTLIVAFTHDSITGECPEAKGPACAKRLAELMYQASREICPDAASPTEPSLMRRLGKGAEPVYNADGDLIPWCPWVACRAAVTAALKDVNVTPAVWRKLKRSLLADNAPFVVDDVLSEFGCPLPASCYGLVC